MPPDATQTKRRILESAHAEFAHYGLAGARVDRIADTAVVNKRSIYMHFGAKEELFDLTVARAITDMAAAVPFTANDLPAYGGALFDYLIANPTILRLTTWANLERPEATNNEADSYKTKITALKPNFGTQATDILALVLGLVTAWQAASPALRTHAAAAPWSTTRLRRHRELMTQAIEALASTGH